MLERTHTEHAPWRVIDANDKERARLNCIRSILSVVPYEFNEAAFEPIALPPRQTAAAVGYKPTGVDKRLMEPDHYPD